MVTHFCSESCHIRNSCVMSEYVKMTLFGSYLAVTGIFCPENIQPVKQGGKRKGNETGMYFEWIPVNRRQNV